MKILFDISFIGLGLKTNIKTGVYRFTENILIEFLKNKDIDLLFTLTYNIETYPLVIAYLQNLHINPSKLITPPKKCIGWYNPYHFGNKKLRSLYHFFGINNYGSIPKKYIQTADLFYSPYYPIPTYLHNIKTAITIYDLIPVMPQYAHFINTDLIHIKQEIQHILNSIKNSYIATISHFTKQDLLAFCPNINPARVLPIHLGIDTKKFNAHHTKADWERVKKTYNLPATYFLTLGTVEPRKNGLHIIKSFNHFVQKYGIDNVYLVVAGNLTFEYQQILKNEITNQHILFTGRVEDDDIAILYAKANSFYFMSFAEGFGFPPLEAMACGVPVVTSNTTSLPEIIGTAGITLSPTDVNSLSNTMYKLYTEEAMRKNYIQLGLDHIKKFTWQNTANQYYQFFKQVINEKN